MNTTCVILAMILVKILVCKTIDLKYEFGTCLLCMKCKIAKIYFSKFYPKETLYLQNDFICYVNKSM